MLITLILVSALLAGGAVLTQMQVKSTKGAQMTRAGLTSMYCAESGVTAARATVMNNYASWNAALGQTTEPSWITSGVAHDIDGDGTPDFTITLKDNDDDGDTTKDNDLTIYVVSKCIRDSDTPATVAELVRFNGGGNCYQGQLGGCGGNNNAN